MWILLLNHYRSYRQISTIGEIDCPNPKRFNSQSTQNPFLILEGILNNNFCLNITFSNWPQVPLIIKKNCFWKQKNWSQIFNCWPKRPERPAKKTLDIVIPEGTLPAEIRPRPLKQCNNFFAKIFFLLQNFWSCPRGAGRRQKSLLDGATDFL